MPNTDLCIELARCRHEKRWNMLGPATRSAFAILQDCMDRRTIKSAFAQCDDDVIQSIVEAWVSIISKVHSLPNVGVVGPVREIGSAPRDGTDILVWNGLTWLAARWSTWGGGIWQCSNTGFNLVSTSDRIKYWMPMPVGPE